MKCISSITLPVFLWEVLQVVLVEVLIARRAKNFLWQITDDRRGSWKNKGSLVICVSSFFLSISLSLSLLRCPSRFVPLKKLWTWNESGHESLHMEILSNHTNGKWDKMIHYTCGVKLLPKNEKRFSCDAIKMHTSFWETMAKTESIISAVQTHAVHSEASTPPHISPTPASSGSKRKAAASWQRDKWCRWG